MRAVEFVCLRQDAALATKTAEISFEETAALCDEAILAQACLRQADLRKGPRALIYGASGFTGTAEVQLARHLDAHVTAVCNTSDVETVRSLGADEVIDCTRQDFTKNGQTHKLIFDAVGNTSFRRCRHALERGGICLETDGLLNLILAVLTRRIKSKRVIFLIPPRHTRQAQPQCASQEGPRCELPKDRLP
jgi:NADPH:quinone reductase-like Zn-dependent oxidoreductase